MRIYLIRHGESVANKNFIVAGQHDSPLSEQGIAQAHALGKEIAKKLEKVQIVCSTMKRARKTAEIIAPYTCQNQNSIITSKLCIERNLGVWEGRGKHWYLDTLKNKPEEIEPDFEPAEDLEKRAQEFLEFLKSLQLDEVIVVAHQGFNKMLRAIVLNPDNLRDWFAQPSQANCELIEITI